MPISLELKAGLGGYAVTGHATEIRIQLYSAAAAAVDLEISDANGLNILPVQLGEHLLKTLWLPVTVQRDKPINVRLRTDGGTIVEERLILKQNRTPLTIISASVPVSDSFDQHRRSTTIAPVILSAESLPHTTQAYAGIEAFVTDLQSLSSLSERQYDALAHYIGRCGTILVAGTDEVLLQRLQKISGCGGRFIDQFDSLSQVIPKRLKLNAGRPPQPPTVRDLLSLQETAPPFRMDVTLPVYMTTYMLLMTLATWWTKKAPYLLLLPACIAGAGVLVWSGMGSAQLVSWLEIESNDDQARVTRLLLLGGDRRGESRFTLSPEINLFNSSGDRQHLSIHYQPSGTDRTLRVHTPLLAPQAYRLTSVTQQSPGFQLTINDGWPEVVFTGMAPAPETLLIWRGKSYRVPSLSKDQRWRPKESLGRPAATPAERLLQKRLAFEDPALLLPLVDSAHDANSDAGWLIINHNHGRLL